MQSSEFRQSGLAIAVVLLLAACSGSGDNGKKASMDHLDAMSVEHAGDNADPSGATSAGLAVGVNSLLMPYTENGDELVYGYFSAPADMFEPLPAVIMIHEWWGLNDNIKAMADRLAAEGYIVFAVDMYGGRTADDAAQARTLMQAVIDDPVAASDNIRAAYEFVADTAGAPRVGSLGWCFGGSWSLNAAQLLQHDIDATVIYYGQVSADEEQLAAVSAPILGIFAAEDQGIKVESVEAFEAALQRLRKDFEIHIYPDVGHAFANPSGANYEAASAEDAWGRTLEFLSLHLASAQEDSD